MEPKLIQFLNRIMRTIGLVVLWMTLNSTFGIMLGYAFIEGVWQVGNKIFYAFLLLSSIGVFYTLYQFWRHPIVIKEE
jgi:hypothetical protein